MSACCFTLSANDPASAMAAYNRNSTTVTALPPRSSVSKVACATEGCVFKNSASPRRNAPVPCPWIMRIRGRLASTDSSIYLSTSSLACSTVMPITLISPFRLEPRSSLSDVTLTLSRLFAWIATVPGGASFARPVTSSLATFMRNGPASISSEEPSSRRKMTGLLKPRTRIFVPDCKLARLIASADSVLSPKSCCDSAMVCTTAAFHWSFASPRTPRNCRPAVFSSCLRSSRSCTASTFGQNFVPVGRYAAYGGQPIRRAVSGVLFQALGARRPSARASDPVRRGCDGDRQSGPPLPLTPGSSTRAPAESLARTGLSARRWRYRSSRRAHPASNDRWGANLCHRIQRRHLRLRG